MKIDTTPLKLTNVDVALIQLERAIALFLDEKDYLSSLTLAGAAEEVLGELVKRHGEVAAIDRILDDGIMIQRKLYGLQSPRDKLASSLNECRNKLKHFNGNEPLYISAGYSSSRMIERAIDNYLSMGNEKTKLIERYLNEEKEFDFSKTA